MGDALAGLIRVVDGVWAMKQCAAGLHCHVAAFSNTVMALEQMTSP